MTSMWEVGDDDGADSVRVVVGNEREFCKGERMCYFCRKTTTVARKKFMNGYVLLYLRFQA